MKTLIRAVTIAVLLSGAAGVAHAQRGWVDVEIGRRPWVRGHVVVGPRHHHHRYVRPHVYRPHAYRYHRRPVVIVPRAYYYRHHHRHYRGHRSHYRWF